MNWSMVVDAAVVGVLGVLVMVIGDPIVRRVFRAAGDVPSVDESAAQRELETERARREAADALVGADLGELSALEGDLPAVRAARTPAEAAGDKLRGGKVIGLLERVAAYACILAGFPMGIAAIVAVKGLARYPDLKGSDGTAERFILGTFASILTAAAGAGLAYWLVRSL